MTMTIAQLIVQAQSRLTNLSTLRASAERLGDTEQVLAIDAQIIETQTTLNALQTLD
jgi:hypothetical protein